MSGEVMCSGWLRKSPPEKKLRRYAWKKRWFVLRSGRLSGDADVLEYYKSESARKPIRIINLNLCEQVDSGLTFDRKEFEKSYIFDLRTIDRTFYLVADSEHDMNKWVRCICDVCGFNSTDSDDVVKVQHPMAAPSGLGPHGHHLGGPPPPSLLTSQPRLLPQRQGFSSHGPPPSSSSSAFSGSLPPMYAPQPVPVPLAGGARGDRWPTAVPPPPRGCAGSDDDQSDYLCLTEFETAKRSVARANPDGASDSEEEEEEEDDYLLLEDFVTKTPEGQADRACSEQQWKGCSETDCNDNVASHHSAASFSSNGVGPPSRFHTPPPRPPKSTSSSSSSSGYSSDPRGHRVASDGDAFPSVAPALPMGTATQRSHTISVMENMRAHRAGGNRDLLPRDVTTFADPAESKYPADDDSDSEDNYVAMSGSSPTPPRTARDNGVAPSPLLAAPLLDSPHDNYIPMSPGLGEVSASLGAKVPPPVHTGFRSATPSSSSSSSSSSAGSSASLPPGLSSTLPRRVPPPPTALPQRPASTIPNQRTATPPAHVQQQQQSPLGRNSPSLKHHPRGTPTMTPPLQLRPLPSIVPSPQQQRAASSSSPVLSMQRPPVNRELKPDRKVKPPPVDLPDLCMVAPIHSPESKSFSRPDTFRFSSSPRPRPPSTHSTTSSSDSQDSEENYVPMRPNQPSDNMPSAGSKAAVVCAPPTDGIAPCSGMKKVEYLALDLQRSTSPNPPRKQKSTVMVAVVPSESRVDYVEVDQEKTRALQSTRQAWTDVRQSSESETPAKAFSSK
ncbi:GRB2-associated-binding protein 1 isoform X1 [Lethenteron reissneri]|uniref:GRB2-associated-binding protein 1 isoform X1 n=2 Tax=Lethenteron reissneri TaxID=7753 RepID=UPI002AB619E3|nr:GRB2-associated-binding protein 1 isoform X1 [Lethenteron reissneri]